jgi:hypothetical protein
MFCNRVDLYMEEQYIAGHRTQLHNWRHLNYHVHDLMPDPPAKSHIYFYLPWELR